MNSATYSPDDNKLRLSCAHRLDAETYARAKAAGFRWAPKQEVFFATWCPAAEDFAVELAGEIGDDDTSLCDRAEARAERFEGYSDNRAQDAESARKAVAAISDHIPFGQPILVGHHSERHARRDAEKIENGMRRAVRMWETSQYWTERAAGALRHAKYKERPDVRERRIKGIEADLRKVQRSTKDADRFTELWQKATNEAQALAVANFDHISREFPLATYPRLRPDASQYEGAMSLWSAIEGGVIGWELARDIATRAHQRGSEHRARWIAHYENRLTYERAMLADQGGGAADRWNFEVGGQILRRYGQWFYIVRVNPTSVSVSGHFASTVPFDEIKDYRPPTPEQTAAVAKAMKTPPLCNYPGEGFKHLTRAELAAAPERRWSDFPKTETIKATDTHGAHRVPCCRGVKQWDHVGVYLTDAPLKPAPLKDSNAPALNLKPTREPGATRAAPPAEKPQAEQFAAMKETLRAGVQVVSAPQLFPTPADLAARMVELADIQPGDRVLEPSAGTGNLLTAVLECGTGAELVAVEINFDLAKRLRAYGHNDVRTADFLACNGDLGTFDRILMNPPFAQAQDIEHIEHALHMLKPGGKLVAICANGPRQQERLKPIADEWHDLAPDTFAGTSVRAALLTISKPA